MEWPLNTLKFHHARAGGGGLEGLEHSWTGHRADGFFLFVCFFKKSFKGESPYV